MLKIVFIYFIGVIFTTLAAYAVDLCNEDKEMELKFKRVINLIFSGLILFLMAVIIKNWAMEVKNAATYLEILKTTLINDVFFLLLVAFGNIVVENTKRIRKNLFNLKIRKQWEKYQEEKQEELN
jgi:hypothetical protein